MKNTDNSYGWLSISLHWTIAILLIGLFFLGYWMVDLSYYDIWYQKAPALHKSIGIIVFIFMLIRLFWRITQVQPRPLSTSNAFETTVSHLVHKTLYVLPFIILLSGYLISTADGRPISVFELFEIPSLGALFNNQEDIAGLIHKYVAYVMMAIVSLHALAALKHHFIDKDGTLKRMLGRS
ncbi:cytochrome b [Marinomonas agarivorans]|nr:cytochrome b [Marinomonas agarivorans]